MLAMKVTALFATTLLSLAATAPIEPERRQLNGLLGSLAGTLGVNQTFDYIVLGGGTVQGSQLPKDLRRASHSRNY